MDKQRNFPINKTQKDILIEFMKKHPELQSGRFSSEFTFKKAQNLWEEVAEIVNACPGGALKDWRQWRKTWQDLKKNIKHKAVESKSYSNKTGGGGPNPMGNLKQTDLSILEMISPVLIMGIPAIKESTIHFESIQPSQPMPNVEMDCTVVEINNTTETDIWPQNTEHIQSSDHPYSLNFPHATPQSKGTPKKINKTKRLESSLKLSQQLINGMDKKNGISEGYYKKKEDYLDHRKEYEIKKLEALQNANKINSEILNTVKSINEKIEKFVN